jgi:hypothetical protein
MQSFKKRMQSYNNQTVVMGHFTYGIHKFADTPYEYATILRHPAPRALSDFDFTKLAVSMGQPHISKPYINGTIRDYVSRAPGVQNLYTRQLCGKGAVYPGELTDEDFDTALANLKTFKYLGVLDRIGKFWNSIQRDYQFSSNIGHERKAKSYTVQNMKQDDIDFMLKYNQYDMELYKYADTYGA